MAFAVSSYQELPLAGWTIDLPAHVSGIAPNMLSAAALRERVGIDSTYAYRAGVETIWTQQMTDENGFERIYVAALRSVGIAARLNEVKRAELWAGSAWQNAPRPVIANWSKSIEFGNGRGWRVY